MLKIFNTLTKQKEQFRPIKNDSVQMYVCGITAYDLCHIGHGRTFIVFDLVARYLRNCGYIVNYVRNITDIDDKIIKRAIKNGETNKQLTNRIITEMHQDFNKLNILKPNYEPRATQYITSTIKIINKLINNGHAYIASNGDIMFSVDSDPNYGILSNQKLEKLQSGSRIKIVKSKKNPLDFVLWKMSKTKEPKWSSPWGIGRPGWHIECSAINSSLLGSNFDIHGGGSDLIFPHHENEIAQSRCASISSVNIWMHTGMVMINNEKMSKSLNNFLTIRDALKQFPAETLRFFLTSSHYRSQINYTEKNLKQAHSALKHLYMSLHGTDETFPPTGGEYFIEQFNNAMNDDFNTPIAYSVLFKMAHTINKLKTKNFLVAQGIAATLRQQASILGLFMQQNSVNFFKKNSKNENKESIQIKKLIQERDNARKNCQWELADQIRDRLSILGIIVEDNLNGDTIWYQKK